MDKEQIIDRFKNYVELLIFPDWIKENLINFEGNRTEYLCFPHYFSEAFDSLPSRKLDLLAFAGFMLYNSMRSKDNFIDAGIAFSPKTLEETSYLEEECIKTLCQIFPINSELWTIWNERKREFYKSVATEKQKSQYEDIEAFERYAEQKYAVGKIAIDSLYMLSSKRATDNYHCLLSSFTDYAAGLQVLDDLQDLVADFNSERPNIVLYHLQKEGQSLAVTEKEIQGKAAALKPAMLQLALNYFEKALRRLRQQELETLAWYHLLESHLERVKKRLGN